MKVPTTLRLGSAVIVSLDGRRFTFQDPHNPHNVVTIEDADVVDLIAFLHQQSRKAAQAIKIEVRDN